MASDAVRSVPVHLSLPSTARPAVAAVGHVSLLAVLHSLPLRLERPVTDYAYCRNGHLLVPENVVIRSRSDGKEQRICRLCRREQQRLDRRRAKRPAAVLNVDPATPETAINAFHFTPYSEGRTVIVIGQFSDASRWVTAHKHDRPRAVLCDCTQDLADLVAARTHFVILDSYTQLPEFWSMQVQIRLLERGGATVERA